MCGAGGTRTHGRQITRKPTRLTSPLDGDLLTVLPLVRRDAPGLVGMSRNQLRWDGCSHNVLTRRYPEEVANLRRTTSPLGPDPGANLSPLPLSKAQAAVNADDSAKIRTRRKR